jgi:hypothetical protein
MRALFILTPSESKRLIGKAVAEMEEVKRAKQYGKMIIGHGSTNVYVAEEILGKEKFSELTDGDKFLSGVIIRGVPCATLAEEKPPILFLNKGVVEPPAPTMAEMVLQFDRNCVFIKGANAVDPEGNAGVFMASPEGGTIGWAIGVLLVRGIKTIVPVGLEKLIPSVKKAVGLCGQQMLDYSSGLKAGMMPIANATVITEIEALKILSGVESTHVASGGCSGSEGSVTLISEGDPDAVEQAIRWVESIKGEPQLMPRKGICLTCNPTSPAQSKDYKFSEIVCGYARKTEEQLPHYLKNR